MERFSRRHGFEHEPKDITIRYEAPSELRSVVLDLARESGVVDILALVCKTLRVRNDGNWSADYIARESQGKLDSAEWFEVYDVIEAISSHLRERRQSGMYGGYGEKPPQPDHFEAELNRYFMREGIGWGLENGVLRARGDQAFEASLSGARDLLRASGRPTAGLELGQALADLSRRPNPDVTGSIQHALAAIECVFRDVVGDPKSTLGKLLSQNPGVIPAPLDAAVEKAWGFASEHGRHLREGRVPAYEEAELCVHIASAVCTYLARRTPAKATGGLF